MSEEDSSPQSVDDLLDCVQLVPEHLRTNGAIHSNPFGGITELIDNAVDSHATNVTIQKGYYTRPLSQEPTKRYPYYTVSDNGDGMDREEALKTILIGHSLKRGDVGKIGQFGNGLKSGSMRVGDTMLLATKKENEFTVLMISLKYLDTVPGNKCLAPCISYKYNEFSGMMTELRSINEKVEKHAAALSIILQWSPFGTEEDLLDFLKVSIGGSGTVVVLSDLKRLENNEFELQWIDDDLAMKRRDADGSPAGFDYLSKWLEDLYLTPKVSIFFNNRQVRLRDPLRSFASPRCTPLSTSGMASFKRREEERVTEELKKLESAKLPLQQRLNTIQAQLSIFHNNRELKIEHRMKAKMVNDLKEQCDEIKKRLPSIGKDKPGSDIHVYFGLDVERRDEPRAIFYSSGRRILAKPFKANGEKAFKMVMGVVCIVDIPSTLLPTKPSREEFEVPAEFEFVFKKIERHAQNYFKHIDKEYKEPLFWKSLGYDKDGFNQYDVPDRSKDAVRKKIFELMGRGRRQCGRCREFRSVTWEAFIEEKNATKFLCAVDNDDESCVPKTPAERRAEEIKQLDYSVKESSFNDSAAGKETVAKKPMLTLRRKNPSVSDSSDDDFQPTATDGKNGGGLSAVRSRLASVGKRGVSLSTSSSQSSPAPKRIAAKSSAPAPKRAASSRSTAKNRAGGKRKKRRSIESSEEGNESDEDDVARSPSPERKRGRGANLRRTSMNPRKSTRTSRRGFITSDEEEEEEEEYQDSVAASATSRNLRSFTIPKLGESSQKRENKRVEDDITPEEFPLFSNDVKREEPQPESMEYRSDERALSIASTSRLSLEESKRIKYPLTSGSQGEANGPEKTKKMEDREKMRKTGALAIHKKKEESAPKAPKAEPAESTEKLDAVKVEFSGEEGGASSANRSELAREEKMKKSKEELVEEMLALERNFHQVRRQHEREREEREREREEMNEMLRLFASMGDMQMIGRAMEDLRTADSPIDELAEIVRRGGRGGQNGPSSVDHYEEC